jgi:transposase-like protein
MPTEDSEHIIPLLCELKAAYGTPLALVHDMGRAILKAVATVFPTVPDYICHFHFLRDLGKDLFDFEYRTIRRYTHEFKAKATLSKARKALQEAIDNKPALSDNLQTYPGHKTSHQRQPTGA